MSDVGSVWLGHGLLIAACAVGSTPLLLLGRKLPRDDEQRQWAARTTLFALALLAASMGSFRIHNSDQSHLEAADLLMATTLITGVLLGAVARSKWSLLCSLGFGTTSAIAFPFTMITTLAAGMGAMSFEYGEPGPGALANFPAGLILGVAFPVYGGLAAVGLLLALRDAVRARRSPGRVPR